MPAGGRVFSALDAMLRRDPSRFQDLFRRACRVAGAGPDAGRTHSPSYSTSYGTSYGTNSSPYGDGSIPDTSVLPVRDVAEHLVLGALGRGKATPADGAYVEAVLGLEGFRSVTEGQLQDVIKVCALAPACVCVCM